MLDRVFTDAIGALRDTMENALLERQAFEERFQVDVLLGDVTWETSYGLPGEGSPPRVRADLTITFGCPKRGHWLYPARAFVGALEVVDIGLLPSFGPDDDPGR